VWLYFRVTLSLRDVEEMLAQRGIDVSQETIRAWTVKSGPKIAANLRRRKLPPSPLWHPDEVVCKIAGERVYLWRAVDDEGEVLDIGVQKRRDTRAAQRTHICRSEGASESCLGSSPGIWRSGF
jgi:transposase-like protein